MALELTSLIPIIIGAAIIYLLVKNAGKLAKWLLIILIIGVVLSTGFGVNLIDDVTEFRDRFPQAQKLILLEDDGEVMAGFSGTLTDSDDVISYVNESKLAEYNDEFEDDDLEAIRENNFKLFIVNTGAFDDIDQIQLSNGTLSSDDALDAIRDEDTFSIVVEAVIDQSDLPDQPPVREFVRNSIENELNVHTEEEIDGLLFAKMYSVAARDSLFLIRHYQEENIMIHPETITFKTIKVIPLPLIEAIAG